jgi:hypothetical protein
VRARLEADYARIAPYVIGAEGEQPGSTFIGAPAEFTGAVTNLLAYVQTRATSVRQALAAAR